ncbi:MAG: hypothetical protein ACRDVM_05000, partial [Acidimicrobiia bacterium]
TVLPDEGRRVGGRPARRRVLRGALASGILAKLLVGSVALAAAGGAAAATGTLPDPVQSAVADLAGRVGIILPSPASGQPSVADGVLDEAEVSSQEHCDQQHPVKAADCDVLQGVFDGDPSDIRDQGGAGFGADVAEDAADAKESGREQGELAEEPPAERVQPPSGDSGSSRGSQEFVP